MLWLACLVVMTSPFLSECQDTNSTEDELRSLLHDAMTDVLAQQADEMSRPYSPPLFEMPSNFMRSFRPGTGVGNREELIIDKILPFYVYSESTFSSFLYKRFNNSDYMVGISSNNVILSKIDGSLNYLLLTRDDAVTKDFDFSATVKDVVLFTRFTRYSEALYIAVLVHTQKTSVVNVYEVFGNRAVVVAVIDLKMDPATSQKFAKKIAYIQSSLGDSLVVLVETQNVLEINYKQEGSSELNHYIEMNYPAAVDLITFTVRGHGYIAVANSAFCDIFKLSESVRDHKHFDRIGPLSNIEDLEYFRIGFHHILAIVDSNGARLHTWRSGEFAEKQIIPFSDGVQVYASAVESCRDEVILLMIKRDGDAIIYAFSGQKETFIKMDAAIPQGHLMMRGSVTSFTYRSRVVVLFMSIQNEVKAIVIETSLKSLKDPLLVEGELVSGIIKDIQDTLDNQTAEIKRIQDILKTAVRSSGNQHITAFQHFKDISSTTGTVVEVVNNIVLGWENSKLTLDEYRRGTQDLEKEVKNLENLVAKIEGVIPDLVLLDQDADIFGQKIFTGNVVADTLIATSLKITDVGDVNLEQLQKEVYRLDKSQQIDGTLTFRENLTIAGSLEVDRTINGIDISEEVMTTHTHQISEAEMIFTNKLVIAGNLDVTGKVNGIDISDEVVTLNGTHHISGTKEFLNGIEAVDVHTTLLDGLDVDSLYHRAFTVSGNQSISADTSFSKITTNDIVLKGLLNGYDIRELEKNIVRTDKPANITGYKTFMNDVIVDGELTVKGTVNGLNIPDDLFLTDVTRPVTGAKEFLGHVSSHDVNVLEKIDGIKIPEDVVTLSGDEEIPSTLYFTDGIVAEKNIVVEGLVDGVDISEIAKQAMKLNESNVFPHTVFLGPVTISGNLTVNGLVNNVDLKQLVDDIVFKDEYPVKINARKHFKRINATIVQLDSGLNGYNIDVDFMKVRGYQIINGTKTFKQKVSLNSIYIEDGMIGGLNVSDIYRQRIKLAIDEPEIDHDIEFADHVIVNGELTIHGTVNDLKIPDDVVLRHSTKGISNKHFVEVSVDNLIVDGDVTVDTFGGRNITQFYNDRITLGSYQTIPGDVWLGTSSADKVTISGLVNGIDFKDFADNVMSKTKSQIITAVKEFSGDVAVHEPITTGEGVNGLNLTDVKKRAFKLLEDNIVTVPLEFGENVTFANLVTGDINGVDITRLAEDSLKKSGIQHVKGDTVFNAGFHVIGDILATKVNGLVIADDVLLKTRPQEIHGQFTLGNVGIGGDLSIRGSINGLDLSEIAPLLARIDKETVIESNITFSRPIHVHDNVEVTGKVNDVDLKQLFDNVLRKTGDQNITGSKVFRGNVTLTGDIDVEFVNGMNWSEFLKDVVWTNDRRVVESTKTFRNDVIVQKDVFVSGIAHVNLINGINLQRFIDEAVYLDTPTNISGPIVFKSPVEINGDLDADLINGLRLKKDVITILCSDDGPQVITGQKTFHNLGVFGDVHADTVNSYNLHDLYEDTLLIEGDQTVEGHKVISGDVVFKKDVHPSMVNGMILERDLVTLSGDQKIEGPVTFKGDVFVEKDMLVDGLVNGVDVQNISRDAVYLKSDQIIEGSYFFENAVALSNVEVEGTVNNIDLRAFDRNVTEFLKNTNDSLEIMEKFARDHCELANFLQDSLKNSYYDLDSFVIHQEMDHPASFVEVGRSRQEMSLLYLDDDATMATSVQNIWDETARKFYVANSSRTYVSRSISYTIGNLRMIINIGINSKDSSVVIQGLPVNIPSGFVDAAVVVWKDAATVTLLFPAKGTCDTYLVKEYSGSPQTELETSLIVGKKATSIVMFELSDMLYLAVSSSHLPSYTKGSSEIYSRPNGNWQKVQYIPTYSSPFVKHFTYHNYHYLAFANNAPVYDTKEAMSIQIYRNSGPNELIFSLFQKVPFDGAIGMEVFQFGDLSQLHLLAWNETIIQIFILEGESGMRDLFTLHGKCVKEVKPLLLSKDLYLIVGQQNLMTGDETRSLLYRGIAKGVKYEPYDMAFC